MNSATMEYWAAKCKFRCNEINAFTPVEYDKDNTSKRLNPVPKVEVFEATCPAGHRSEYIISELFVLNGPLAPGFQRHPDFLPENN